MGWHFLWRREGQGIGADNIVVEGKSYGPFDQTCTDLIQYQRSCGHLANIQCSIAFSANRPSCSELVEIKSPLCGHRLEVTCSEIIHVGSMNRPASLPSYISVVQEGQSCDELYASSSSQATLPAKCKFLVSFNRKCGHESKVTCSEAFKLLRSTPACEEIIQAKSPLCGHKLSIKCFVFNSWKPWKEEFVNTSQCRQLMDHHEIPEDSELPQQNTAVKCAGMIVIHRPCSHSVEMKCDAAFSKLATNTLSKCMEKKSTILSCGHEVTLKCDAFDNFMLNPTCKVLMEAKCWNYSECDAKVNTPCHKSSMSACNTSVEW